MALAFDSDNKGRIEGLWLEYVNDYEKAGGDLNGLTNINDWELVHLAAANGFINVVKWLKYKGVDINKRDGEGVTPFFHALDFDIENAVQYNNEIHFDKSKLIAELGGDISIKDNQGISPEEYCKSYDKSIYNAFVDTFR
jgi:ankyrin repeat protein